MSYDGLPTPCYVGGETMPLVRTAEVPRVFEAPATTYVGPLGLRPTHLVTLGLGLLAALVLMCGFTAFTVPDPPPVTSDGGGLGVEGTPGQDADDPVDGGLEDPATLELSGNPEADCVALAKRHGLAPKVCESWSPGWVEPGTQALRHLGAGIRVMMTSTS